MNLGLFGFGQVLKPEAFSPEEPATPSILQSLHPWALEPSTLNPKLVISS